MKYSVVYHPKVEDDVTKAKDWYRSKKSGLDRLFSKEVKEAIFQIINEPLLFQKRHKNVRVAFTRIFPFGVHYVYQEELGLVTIIGIYHTSLSPEEWEKRER